MSERAREHKYRFAQAMVFGLPVIALQLFGRQLGGAEAPRWIALLQAVLSGWIACVACTGMITEGIVLLIIRRRLTADLLVALVAVAIEVFSVLSVLHILVSGQIWYRPLLFHVVVVVLVGWCGLQWARCATVHRRASESPRNL